MVAISLQVSFLVNFTSMVAAFDIVFGFQPCYGRQYLIDCLDTIFKYVSPLPEERGRNMMAD